MELFRIFGTIGLEDGDAKKRLRNIDNQASGLSERISKTGIAIGTAFGNLIAQGVVKLGEAIVGIGPSLVRSAASAEALGAQFEQVFGEAQDGAQSLIDGLGKEFGMVPNRIKPAMTQMTSMFKGLGMDTKNAMGTAKDAVTMVADAAAFYDKSFEDANSSLNSFIKGNYEGGEAIGLFANETQLASYASKELGLDWKNLDEAGKQVARLEYAKAMQEAAGATGQAARESDSLENQLGNLRQVWDDLKAKFGAPILEPAVAGIQRLSEWLQGVDTSKVTAFADWAVSQLPVVEEIFSNVFSVISNVTGQVWQFFKDKILPILAEWFGNVQTTFPVIKKIAKDVFKGIVEYAKTVWDFFKVNILPIFASLYNWIQGHMPTIRSTTEKAFNKIVEVTKKAWNFFKNNILPILAEVYQYIQSKMPQIQSITEKAFKTITNVVKIAWGIFENLLLPALKKLWDWISPHLPMIKRVVKEAFDGIIAVVETAYGVFEKITGAIQKAVDWLGKWNNKPAKNKTATFTENRHTKYSQSGVAAQYATGTNYHRGGVALVGERGPELVHLPKGSKVDTANETKQKLSGNENPIVIQPAPIYLDNQLIGEAVFDVVDNRFATNAQLSMYMKGARG